jgi:hypothetical protein
VRNLGSVHGRSKTFFFPPYSTAFILAVGPYQPRIQWLPGALSSVVNKLVYIHETILCTDVSVMVRGLLQRRVCLHVII